MATQSVKPKFFTTLVLLEDALICKLHILKKNNTLLNASMHS